MGIWVNKPPAGWAFPFAGKAHWFDGNNQTSLCAKSFSNFAVRNPDYAPEENDDRCEVCKRKLTERLPGRKTA